MIYQKGTITTKIHSFSHMSFKCRKYIKTLKTTDTVFTLNSCISHNQSLNRLTSKKKYNYFVNNTDVLKTGYQSQCP